MECVDETLDDASRHLNRALVIGVNGLLRP